MDASWVTGLIGAVAGLSVALGGIWNERRKIRIEAAKQEAERKAQADKVVLDTRTVEETANDKLWQRVTETLADYSKKIQLIETERDRIMQEKVLADAACEKRITQIEGDLQSEIETLRKNLRTMSRLCHEQQLQMDAQGIKLSEIDRRQKIEDLPGGRRLTDPPVDMGHGDRRDQPQPSA